MPAPSTSPAVALRRPGPSRVRGHPSLALVIMLSAQLMIILDMTVVNIALPHIQAGLHFSTDGLSWVLNAYTLTFGGLLLLGGRAGDILARRRMFLAGIILFTLACSQAAWPLRRGGCWPPAPCRALAARWPRPPCSRW